MRIFKNIILILSITFMYAHEGHNHKSHKYSGGIIRGSVVDSIIEESKKYANISIVDGASDDIIDGGITDAEGMFLIDNIPFGRYYIVVEYIGYEDKIIDDIQVYPPNNLVVDLGVVQISPKMILVDGVSVVERAAPIIEDIEKTTYPVAETARTEGGSAFSFY